MADTKINGALFQSMVTEGALAITEQKEQINELNVFPVPDGDTGTNMSMTMTAASAAMSVRYVSSEKSWWPGVSRMFTQQPS